MTEFGAREAELGRQPRRARAFVRTDNSVEEGLSASIFAGWKLETSILTIGNILDRELPDSVLEKSIT